MLTQGFQLLVLEELGVLAADSHRYRVTRGRCAAARHCDATVAVASTRRILNWRMMRLPRMINMLERSTRRAAQQHTRARPTRLRDGAAVTPGQVQKGAPPEVRTFLGVSRRWRWGATTTR